jgi:transcription elongation factor SPT4
VWRGCLSHRTAMADAVIPSQKAKNLRACLLCAIVQSAADFRRLGCPNCEEIMGVRVSFRW